MTRRYYTLLQRDSASDPWRIEFGSYSLTEVEDERADREYHYPEAEFEHKIICTDEDQAAIADLVFRLNSGETNAPGT